MYRHKYVCIAPKSPEDLKEYSSAVQGESEKRLVLIIRSSCQISSLIKQKNKVSPLSVSLSLFLSPSPLSVELLKHNMHAQCHVLIWQLSPKAI